MKKLSSNNTAVKMLQYYVMSKYREMNEERIRHEIMNSELSYEQILINETQKSLIRQKKRRGVKHSDFDVVENPRNVETIFYSLLNFKGFIRYINFQGLTREDIRQTAIFLKYKFYPKETYIFRKFQKSDKLFGIIQGKVSIRESEFSDYTKKFHSMNQLQAQAVDIHPLENIYEKEKAYCKMYNDALDANSDYSVSNFLSSDNDMNNNDIEINYNDKYYNKTIDSKCNSNKHTFHTNKEEDPNANFRKLVAGLEEEIVVLSSGMCFGDWGVLYNIPRTASAYCLEDTHTFYLEKESFDQILSRKFAKSDVNKINFIYKKLPLLKTQGFFRRILTKITPLYFDKDDIVYTEFRKADEFYLIYQGECSIRTLPNAKSEEEIMLKKKQLIHLLTVDKGGIIGLECCNINSNYENTVIVNRDHTVLFTIKMNYIKEKCNDVISFLQPLFDKQKIILDKEREKHLRENIPTFLQKKKEMPMSRQKNFSLSITPNKISLKSFLTNTTTACSSNTKQQKKTNINSTRIQTYFSGVLSKTIKARLEARNNTKTTNINEDCVNKYNQLDIKSHLKKSKINIKLSLKKTNTERKIIKNSYAILKKATTCISPVKQSHSISLTTNNYNKTLTTKPFLLNKNSIKRRSDLSLPFGRELLNLIDIKKYSTQRKLRVYSSGKYELPLLTEY